MDELIKEIKETLTDAMGMQTGCEYICKIRKTLPSNTYFKAMRNILTKIDELIDEINKLN